MEIIQDGKTILIQAPGKLPTKRILGEAGVVLSLIWGLFAVGFLFFSPKSRGLFPYFVTITLFLIIPLIFGLVLRKARHFSEVLFDANENMLTTKGILRRQEIPFESITEFNIKRCRYRSGSFLFQLNAVLISGKSLPLIRDVPDPRSLHPLGKKLGRLTQKPFQADF